MVSLRPTKDVEPPIILTVSSFCFVGDLEKFLVVLDWALGRAGGGGMECGPEAEGEGFTLFDGHGAGGSLFEGGAAKTI